MNLSLTVVTYQNQPPEQPLAIVIHRQEARIGRAKDNDWILPDKDRYISGHHAMIKYRNQEYFISDASTNGLFINHSDTALGDDNPARLNDGDHLTIGEYEIAVALIEENSNQETSTLPNTSTISDEISFGSFEEYDSNALNQVIDENAFMPDKIEVENEQPGGSVSDYVSPLNEAFSQPREDPIVPPQQTEKTTHPSNPEIKIPEDWLGDDIINDGVPVSKKPTGMVSPFLIDNEENKLQQVTPANQSELNTDFSGEKVDIDSPALERFLEGAELSEFAVKEAMNSDPFYSLGRIFRTAIKGTRDLLMARANIKNEMRLDATTIRPTQNNPLKFSMNVDDALVHLLQQDEGCMPPEQAISEAFDDIRAHQIAVLAGMQTALNDLLNRFDPEILEHRLQKSSPISASIPIHKRAKLWDLFEELHEEIKNEAKENFYQLFGQAFAEAYEDQIQRIRSSNKQAQQNNES